MRVLASGLKKFTSNYIHTKGAETLSKSPNMSEEDADIQVIKCKSHQAEEVFIENINEITPEDVMMTPEIIKDEKSTQTEFELKKQFRHFIEMMEIDREKLKITADQLKNYTEKFQDTAKSTIFAKIILDLVQKTSKLIQREADMIEINQDFLRKQPPVICENQLNYKTDEIPKVFINELDITGVSMQDKILLLDLLKKSKKIKDFLESQFSSQPKSDFSPETLKLKAKKLRFLLDKILNEPQSDNPLLTHNYAQIEAWDETLNFRGTLGDEEDKKSFHSDEDRFYLNTQQIKRKLTLISSRMTEKRLPSRKTHPSDKILVAFIQKLKKKTSNKASISIKMIMKLISSLYNERVLLMNEYPSIKKIPLSEMLYDEMLQKYGLKKVAQQKYKETINSASLYSESSIRIKNFLRFLGLNGHYKNDDLDFYLKTVDDINTGNSTQILVDDVALEVCVAYSRVILILKQIFEDKLPKQEWEILKSSIDLLKKPSESTKKSIFIGDLDVVNIDSVLEIMLSYYGRLKLQFFEFLMGINDSLSSDCSILFNSFIEIFEKLPVRLSEEETQNLFNLYSDLDYENPTNRHIHIDYILSIGVELSLVPFATLPQPTYI